MHKMGGLRRHMPRTYVTFLAGAAALSGLPVLSGFFSKDEILAMNFAAGGAHYGLWIVGVVTAAITAFYTWRMVGLVFFGEERFDAEKVHPHESPPSMTIPLVILALFSILGGVLGLPAVLPFVHVLEHWLEPVTAGGTALLYGEHAPHLGHATEWVLLALGAGIALYFAHQGFHRYKDGKAFDEKLAAERPALHGRLADAWSIDTIYSFWIVQPLKLVAFVVAVIVDQFAIDGAVNGAASGARALARKLRGLSDGGVASYGLWMGAGAAVLALIWVVGGTV